MMPNDSGAERRLQALFEEYREACPTPSVSPNFMPMLWQKIEEREHVTLIFGRLARAFVTAAMAMSLAIGLYLSIPISSPTFADQGSIMDVLADSDAADHLDEYEPVAFEPVTMDEL
jgi:hypothetical protein